MEILLILAVFASILALSYAAFSFFKIKKMDEGTDRMKEIAAAIRVGAGAFINYEMKLIVLVSAAVAAALALLISWQASVAFLLGAAMSESAGFVGMKVATYANVRVTNRARTTRSLAKTLKVAFRGGSVMGLCVSGFALLGVFIVYLVFGIGLGQISDTMGAASNSILGMLLPSYNMQTSFTMTLSGYALGCSVIAMFNRVGGGIYTKAADMGADLVGKTEAHIPEDDPRNPATIADNVGDNVGDVAGLGSDLLESYVGAILSSAILAVELFSKNIISHPGLLRAMIYFPVAFAAVGLIACVLGIATLLVKSKLSENPHRELNMATWVSAAISLVGCFGLSYALFGGFAGASALDAAGQPLNIALFSTVEFAIGWISPAVSATLGIVSGIIIGMIAERYTSYDYLPTRKLASASVDGSALTITQGLGLGMNSCMAPCAVLAVAIYASYITAGMYGVAIAALGMLSFVATTVAVDSYGPIADNAGGIAEMSGLDPEVRRITDTLDSVGNTTAAIGKGFAIASAALATLSMMSSYLFATSEPVSDVTKGALDALSLNIIEPLTLAGALVGAALPFLFSGMLIDAVAKAARKMVEEVRRQFREIVGLLEGKVMPDYKTCIEISSQSAIREMRVPAILAIAFPVCCGFMFGAKFVGGLLLGATLSAIMLAIFCGNSGGAWDNAKKYIETGAIEGHGKGTHAHDAAVVGDTVGDPLKDTVGPSLNILIKIMSTVSLVCVVVFSKFNLVDWLLTLFK